MLILLKLILMISPSVPPRPLLKTNEHLLSIWTEGSDGQNNDGFKIYPSTGTLTNYKYSVYGILDS